jgi:CCR4-NOT transcription complex subunit 1
MLVDRPGGRAVVDAQAALRDARQASSASRSSSSGGSNSNNNNNNSGSGSNDPSVSPAQTGASLMTLSADKRTGLLRAHDARGAGGEGMQQQLLQQQQQQQQQQGGAGLPPKHPGSPPVSAAEGGAALIPNFASLVSVNSSLPLFLNAPQLRRLVPVAVDCALREIIAPVVDRSVSIAVTTARELLLKDFALDGDENRLRTAAGLMARGLAGSLALVTCREPLRVSITNHLRRLVGGANEQRQLVDAAAQSVSQENLELGCAIIERATTDRAAREVDEAIASAVAVRRSYREQTGQPFQDMAQVPAKVQALLPDRLKVDGTKGLTPAQLKVYADYDRLPRTQLPAGVRESLAMAGGVNIGGAGAVAAAGAAAGAGAAGAGAGAGAGPPRFLFAQHS